MRLRTTISVGVAGAAVIGAVLLFTWYARQFGDAILPGLGSTRTTSMALVDVTLRDTLPSAELRLKIPQAYMVRARDRRGGRLESLRVETRLPELTPAPASPQITGSPGSLERDDSLAAFNDSLALTLGNEFVEPDWRTGTTRENWLARFSADPSSGHAVAFELVAEDYSGLLSYKGLSCESRDGVRPDTVPFRRASECRDAYLEYYLSKDEERPTVLIDCDVRHLATLTFRLGCTARTTYRGFRLSYLIRRTQVHRWREFDSGVRRLLDSFVTSAPPQ